MLLVLSLVDLNPEDILVLIEIECGVLEELRCRCHETLIIDSLVLNDRDATELLWVHVETAEEVFETGDQADANRREHPSAKGEHSIPYIAREAYRCCLLSVEREEFHYVAKTGKYDTKDAKNELCNKVPFVVLVGVCVVQFKPASEPEERDCDYEEEGDGDGESYIFDSYEQWLGICQDCDHLYKPYRGSEHCKDYVPLHDSALVFEVFVSFHQGLRWAHTVLENQKGAQ